MARIGPTGRIEDRPAHDEDLRAEDLQALLDAAGTALDRHLALTAARTDAYLEVEKLVRWLTREE